MDPIYVRIRRATDPEWLTQLLGYLTEVFCKRAGKRDEIPYGEAFMLLHQEKKESEDYPPYRAEV